jgi:hypothetical protein
LGDRIQVLTSNGSNLRPTTPYVDQKPKKKRVKSAAKRHLNIPNKKLEEMRRWLEYQRKFTAEEIKKRTDKFKELQESMHPKIDTSVDRNESQSDIRRRYTNYDDITHPYQSTVDDLLRSRYASRLEDLVKKQELAEAHDHLPPLKHDSRRTSPGKPLTLIEFDDLDQVIIHKRK